MIVLSKVIHRASLPTLWVLEELKDKDKLISEGKGMDCDNYLVSSLGLSDVLQPGITGWSVNLILAF